MTCPSSGNSKGCVWMWERAECYKSSCQGIPWLSAQRRGKGPGGSDPPLLSSLIAQGEAGELAKSILQMRKVRLSELQCLPWNHKVSVRLLLALSPGDSGESLRPPLH